MHMLIGARDLAGKLAHLIRSLNSHPDREVGILDTPEQAIIILAQTTETPQRKRISSRQHPK